MGRPDHDAIPAPDPSARRPGRDLAADAPPQRNPSELARSEDLGGVVDPHDSDLFESGGWRSWSIGERLTVAAGFAIVIAVVIVVVATLAL